MIWVLIQVRKKKLNQEVKFFWKSELFEIYAATCWTHKVKTWASTRRSVCYFNFYLRSNITRCKIIACYLHFFKIETWWLTVERRCSGLSIGCTVLLCVLSAAWRRPLEPMALKKWDRWEILMKRKDCNLDMTPCDGKIWIMFECLTHTIWSFCSSFRACLLPGSSFNTSWKSKTQPKSHVS